MRLPSRWLEAAVAAALTVVCLALPTRNPSGDAWYYAACARWGQELWQPHHLLYNAVGYGWLRLVGAAGPAPAGLGALPWLQALNALAAGACLLALGPLLRRAGARPAATWAWLLLVGSCFGLLRFATDNEAYVLPLLPALLASYWVSGFWFLVASSPTLAGGYGAIAAEGPAASRQPPALSHQAATSNEEPRTSNQQLETRNEKPETRNQKLGTGSLLLAGLLAALACLLHQVLAWWWLGLLLELRPWRRGRRGAGLAYAAPALLLGPLAYALAAPGGLAGVPAFALHDYLSGAAGVDLGWRALLLTPIGLVRTLGQVHGNLLPLLHRWPLPLGAVALSCAALAAYGVRGIWRASRATWSAVAAETVAPQTDHWPEIAAAHGHPGASGGQAADQCLAGAGATPGSPPAGDAAAASAGAAWAARRLRRTHLLILGLQLTFAAQAAGNAEFMVMLPLLAAVVLAGGVGWGWPARAVAALGLALLNWNLAFGLLPAHQLIYSDAGPALRARALGQPRAWLLLADPNPLRNQLHYFTGRPLAPRVLGVVQQRPAAFRRWLQARLQAGDTVYTDALGGPHLLDRARLTLGDPAAGLLRGFGARRVAGLPTFYGLYYLSRLSWPAADSTRVASPSSSASAPVTTGAAR